MLHALHVCVERCALRGRALGRPHPLPLLQVVGEEGALHGQDVPHPALVQHLAHALRTTQMDKSVHAYGQAGPLLRRAAAQGRSAGPHRMQGLNQVQAFLCKNLPSP